MFEPVRTCIEPEPCLNLAEPNMNIMSSSCSQIFKKFGHVHVQVREKVPEPDLNRTLATLISMILPLFRTGWTRYAQRLCLDPLRFSARHLGAASLRNAEPAQSMTSHFWMFRRTNCRKAINSRSTALDSIALNLLLAEI